MLNAGQQVPTARLVYLSARAPKNQFPLGIPYSIGTGASTHS